MRYRHFKPSGNPISRFFQVIVASFRKMSLEVPQHGEGLYEIQGKDSDMIGARKLLHSNGFKFLDRAAIITPVDTSFIPEKTSPTNPWRLCTVTQVEELTKRKPKPPSELQRIGVGLSIAVVAIIVAGLLEQQRRKYVTLSGEDISPLSIFWKTPQYVLVGIAEAFVYVAQWEFFSSQTPDGIKSIGLGLSMSSSAMGSYLCSLMLSVVMRITTRNGKPGWVPPNLNDGHLDRFFFLSAALTAGNLGFYVFCARRYKSISLEKREGGKETETIVP
uniref:Uncharacterized protein n=1 Tax=Chenopodium quinoa TaxID=63459 RepID=A0A803LI56_CHEQI